jgi:subtilisin-like proprotein convertase family protein
MSLQHQPVLSGVGTGDQTVILNAVSPRTIANNENKPRLYYSINGGNYQFLYPDDITGSSYKFYIPGQPFGTTVNYYFAVQDQNGLIIETLPRGGRGINPPGSVAPVSQYTYLVAPDYTQTLCSNTVPKAIPDLSTIYDTIPVSYVGGIKDINVNVNIDHTRVSTLNLSLIGPDGTTIDLSSDNGGSGSNFTNTTFDDEAMISIKNGIAPYTGSFKPEQPLSTYDVKEVTGNWILKVQDDAVSQVGTLQNWCITINYFDLSVGIAETSIEKALKLDQNFPNPVFGITNIPFTLPAPGKADIDLYDLYGRKVMSIASGTFASGLNVINVDLSGLSSGTYFYRLVQGDITQTKVLLLNR